VKSRVEPADRLIDGPEQQLHELVTDGEIEPAEVDVRDEIAQFGRRGHWAYPDRVGDHEGAQRAHLLHGRVAIMAGAQEARRSTTARAQPAFARRAVDR
jgi:hypothetical protein